MHSYNDINPSLCTYCGTCIAVCPYSSLSVVDGKITLIGECDGCGICYDTCPGMNFSFPEYNAYLFGINNPDERIGYFKSIHVAHSTNDTIRSNASSGGVVTAILVYAMEAGIIDGAIVVGMDETEPWKPKVKIAKSVDEIIGARQSKYVRIPLNSILQRIKDENGSFGVVGLPCHVHGLRKLQASDWKHNHKIKFIIGLFCGVNLDFSATEYLINKLNVKKSNISSLEYRGGKWPGGFRIITKDGNMHFLDKTYYDVVNAMYVPKRCLLCPDLTSEFADVSIGDAWIEGPNKEKLSTVIVRSEKGDKLMREAISHGFLKSTEISKEDVLKSHSHLIKYKKRGYFVRRNLTKIRPEYELKVPNLSRCEQISGFVFFCVIKLLTTPPIKKAINIFPLRLLRRIALSARKVMRL